MDGILREEMEWRDLEWDAVLRFCAGSGNSWKLLWLWLERFATYQVDS